MNTLFDVLHVVLAVFIVGPMAILPMTAMRSIRAGQGGQVATLAKSTFIFSLLSILVVILGFGLLGMSDPQYGLSVTTGWVMTSLIAWLIAILLNLLVVVPAMRKAAAALQPAGEAGAPAQSKGYPQIAAFSGISTLLLVLVVVLMVWKP
ncbi:DUF2269 family protein [Spelaeicoccus albus]|uniref:Putative membrane protein n=1 Tax=Spelaeicoccus albus TaxID=1280376 RepID=A0A7Z0IH87_9MICO|nr:DUF2269 family protein [Spelaeicoccus albus]NYI67564.1 putative membrane protein [Spelaeicoccus albus]